MFVYSKKGKRRVRREAAPRQTCPARVARLLAEAHDIEARVQAGVSRDYADVARRHGLTRARLTQAMNLLPLAPDIRTFALALRLPRGREPVTERHLRQVHCSPVWAERRAVWRRPLAASAKGATRSLALIAFPRDKSGSCVAS
ncbi:MAG: hypothetical protein KBA95_03425 [Acidobacteria bacterium]|nr:hypothetical protein [Acidobacteriota bacterium]